MLTAPPRDAEVSLPVSSPIHRTSDPDAFVLTWSVHLLHGQTRRLPRIGLCAALVVFGGLLVFHNAVLALLPALTLLLSVSEFLFPTRYTLTYRGVQARQGPVVWEMDWHDVKHAYLASDGIKLSPLSKPGSRMEPLRGVFLRFAANDEAVIAAVRRLREEAAENV